MWRRQGVDDDNKWGWDNKLSYAAVVRWGRPCSTPWFRFRRTLTQRYSTLRPRPVRCRWRLGQSLYLGLSRHTLFWNHDQSWQLLFWSWTILSFKNSIERWQQKFFSCISVKTLVSFVTWISYKCKPDRLGQPLRRKCCSILFQPYPSGLRANEATDKFILATRTSCL